MKSLYLHRPDDIRCCITVTLVHDFWWIIIQISMRYNHSKDTRKKAQPELSPVQASVNSAGTDGHGRTQDPTFLPSK